MKDEQTPQVHLAEGVQLWDGNHTCGYPNIKKTKQKNPGQAGVNAYLSGFIVVTSFMHSPQEDSGESGDL